MAGQYSFPDGEGPKRFACFSVDERHHHRRHHVTDRTLDRGNSFPSFNTFRLDDHPQMATRGRRAFRGVFSAYPYAVAFAFYSCSCSPFEEYACKDTECVEYVEMKGEGLLSAGGKGSCREGKGGGRTT